MAGVCHFTEVVLVEPISTGFYQQCSWSGSDCHAHRVLFLSFPLWNIVDFLRISPTLRRDIHIRCLIRLSS